MLLYHPAFGEDIYHTHPRAWMFSYNYMHMKMDGLSHFDALSLGVEGGIPLYQYVNGLQMKTDWFLTAGVQAMF